MPPSPRRRPGPVHAGGWRHRSFPAHRGRIPAFAGMTLRKGRLRLRGCQRCHALPSQSLGQGFNNRFNSVRRGSYHRHPGEGRGLSTPEAGRLRSFQSQSGRIPAFAGMTLRKGRLRLRGCQRCHALPSQSLGQGFNNRFNSVRRGSYHRHRAKAGACPRRGLAAPVDSSAPWPDPRLRGDDAAKRAASAAGLPAVSRASFSIAGAGIQPSFQFSPARLIPPSPRRRPGPVHAGGWAPEVVSIAKRPDPRLRGDDAAKRASAAAGLPAVSRASFSIAGAGIQPSFQFSPARLKPPSPRRRPGPVRAGAWWAPAVVSIAKRPDPRLRGDDAAKRAAGENSRGIRGGLSGAGCGDRSRSVGIRRRLRRSVRRRMREA